MVPRAENRSISTRAKVISSVVLAAIGLLAWRFVWKPADVRFAEEAPLGSPSHDRHEASASVLASPGPPTGSPARELDALNERTLVGTKWEREGFGIEFGADGKLLIGGRERAQWRVEGSRVRLYREATGEEHWLDIIGNKLMWKGQEIGRVP